MRGAFAALDEGKLVPYATAAFEAYWGDDLDISRDDVLADIATRAGLERNAFSRRSKHRRARRGCGPPPTN